MVVSCPKEKKRIHNAEQGDMFFTPSSETTEDIGWSAVAMEDLPDTVYSYHVIRFRSYQPIDLLFRRYWCNNTFVLNQFSLASRGTTRKILDRGDFRRIVVLLPSAGEQTAIGRFLDWANGRLERAIRAKRKVIALITEQKQAIIHRAVTRGLDPHVRLKPSGIEWLGEVPKHWDTVRNGQLFTQRKETGFPDLPILEVSLKTGVRIRSFGSSDRKQVMTDRSKYKRAAKGDLAYNMMRMWQGAVGVTPVDGLVSPAYVIAKPLKEIEPRYFSALFRTDAYMAEVDKYSRGIVKDRNRLYWEDFKQMPTICPPPNEQLAIADAIDQSTVTMNSGIQRMDREIDLLREYRTRLIADVVTGKLDVREAAERLPAEAEEPPEEVEVLADGEGDAEDANLDPVFEEAADD